MSDSVSRETPLPPEAEGVFGRCRPGAVAFHDLLAGAGVERGLIGPREVDRLWERHLVNCAVVAEAAAPGSTVLDIGSGAGLPGLTWALVRPDLRITLLEPLARRVDFLLEAVEVLGLSGVSVQRGRAEDAVGGPTYDVVTSRAVAPLARLARWSLPLVTPGGTMVALKGRSAEEEVAGARREISRLGGASVSVREFGADWLSTPTRAVVVETVVTT